MSDYIPYGSEWVQEMKKFKKEQLIEKLRQAYIKKSSENRLNITRLHDAALKDSLNDTDIDDLIEENSKKNNLHCPHCKPENESIVYQCETCGHTFPINENTKLQLAKRIAKTAWDTGRISARDVNTIELSVIDEINAINMKQQRQR